MKSTELLAPAKDKETAFVAINNGADAIYIGATSFGARKKASNSIEDIKEIVEYTHKYWVKVYVTLNTILTNEELNDAYHLALKLQEIGVDALIIQDMGLLNKLIKEGYKTPIHISTQCDNYLPQKIKFFNDMGISRVVLARELSLKEIEAIHKANPDLELEAFVHGALCVSMSGQCYLSEYIGGRSANRGECAQPCRKKYTVETTDGEIIKKDYYTLCLKDFNASACLDEMIKAGIHSFKIEGRLKDKNYVKNIVAYYRQKLGKGTSSGKTFLSFTPNPEKSFNRGFTEYFLNGRTDCYSPNSPKSRGEYIGKVCEVGKNWFKIKTNKELHAQDGIYFKDDGFLINKVDNERVYPNKTVDLKIDDEIWRNFDYKFEKDLEKPTKRQIGVNIGVNIGVANSIITITDEDNISISIDFPNGEKANNPEKMKDNFIKQFSKTGDSDFYIENIVINSELPFLPISEINQLRREVFEKLMQERLKAYNTKIKQTQKPLKYAEYFLKELDYRANIHNKSAEEFYKLCGVEKIIEQSFESRKPVRQAELMRCKHCIKYALNMCKSPKQLVLRDEFNKIYPLKFNCKDCEMSILSPID